MEKKFLRLISAAAFAVGFFPSAFADVTLSDVTGGQDLYGYLIAYNSGVKEGSWNSIGENCEITGEWIDSESQYLMLNGWMRRGLLCEVSFDDLGNKKNGFGYITRDVENGDILTNTVYDAIRDYGSFFSSVTYDAKTDSIYGFVMDKDFGFYPVWKKAPGNGNLLQIDNVKVLSDPYMWTPSLCSDPTTGNFYGVTFKGKVVSIDTAGNVTELFSLANQISGTVSGNATALEYFPETGKLLWSGWMKDGSSALYSIDPKALTCEKIIDLDKDEYFRAFAYGKSLDVSDIPGLVTDGTVTFANGSHDGTASFKMPQTTLGGESFAGDIEWQVQVDEDIVASGMAAPGSSVSVEFKDIETGEHTFSIWAIYDSKEGPEFSSTLFIGNDTPLAPESVSLKAQGMTLVAEWTPVTASVHSGWLDLADMSYDVYLNDEFVSNTKDTAWEYEVPAGTQLAGYIVSVCAKCSGIESKITSSKAVACGEPLSLDVYIAPTAEQAALMTYIKDEEDGWKYNNSYDPPVFSSGAHYTSKEPMNTWLIMPPINFPTAGEYQIEFKTATLFDRGGGEYFCTWIGKECDVDAMDTEIVEELNPTKEHPDCDEISRTFTLDEPGIYYIGFQCYSEPRMLGVLLWDIYVKDPHSVGVAEVNGSEMSVCGNDGRIVINNGEGNTANVYTLDGLMVASMHLNDQVTTIDMQPGLYIVSIEGKTYKVVVK